LTRSDIDNLVPLHAALETADGGPMLSGFGPSRFGAGMVAALRRVDVTFPIHAVARGATVSRAMLRDAALRLGLPTPWAHVAHPCGVACRRRPSPFVLSARGHPQRLACARCGLHILVGLAVPEQCELQRYDGCDD